MRNMVTSLYTGLPLIAALAVMIGIPSAGLYLAYRVDHFGVTTKPVISPVMVPTLTQTRCDCSCRPMWESAALPTLTIPSTNGMWSSLRLQTTVGSQ